MPAGRRGPALEATGKRPRGGLGIRSAGADGGQVQLRLNHIAVTRNDQRGARIGDHQQGLQTPQYAVGAPVLAQFHRGPGEVAAVLFQLTLKAFKQGKSVGGATGKPGDDLVVVQAPHFAGVTLHDGITQAHLAVTADNDRAIAAH